MCIGERWPEESEGEDKDGAEEVEQVTQGQAHHQSGGDRSSWHRFIWGKDQVSRWKWVLLGFNFVAKITKQYFAVDTYKY